MELDKIGFTRNAQTERSYRYAESQTDVPAIFGPSGIDPVVQQPPFRSVQVFLPDLFQVDQGALPGTKKIMLERRQGNEILF